MAKIDMKLLQAIADATAGAVGYMFVSRAEGEDMVKDGLIQVNPAIMEGDKAAAKITEKGVATLAQQSAKPAATPKFEVISGGFEAPKSKRGGGGAGAPTVYPFDTMEIGAFFFVPVSDKHKDPVKQLGSTVSAANQRYAVETGVTKNVKRAKRGDDNKALKDAEGKNIMEDVVVKEKRQTRRFVIRKVEAGKTYGTYTAPGDGAVIQRVAIEEAAAA